MKRVGIKDIIKTADHASATFDKAIITSEQKMFAEVVLLIKDLETTPQGNIKASIANLKQVQKIRSKLYRLANNKEYLHAVNDLVKTFDTIYEQQLAFYAVKNQTTATQEKYKLVKTIARENTIAALTGDGIASNVTAQLDKMLLRAVTTGARFADLQKEFHEFLLTTEGGGGALSRYAKTYAVTALSQYAGQNNRLFTDDLGTEWFEYVGSEIETTRPFCNAVLQKRYIHRSEIPELLQGHIHIVNGEDIDVPLYDKTGLPYGMIEGTTAENFQVNCGGWNCRHQLVPIAEEAVPEYIRKDIEERLKPTAAAIAEKRHAQRTEKQIQDIKDRWAARQKKHAQIKKTANNVLKVAGEYGEVDTTTLQKHIKSGNLNAIQAESKAVAKSVRNAKKELRKAQENTAWQNIKKQLAELHKYQTKSSGFHNDLASAEEAVNKGDLKHAKIFTSAATYKKKTLENAKAKKEKQTQQTTKKTATTAQSKSNVSGQTNTTPQKSHLGKRLTPNEAIKHLMSTIGCTKEEARDYYNAAHDFTHQWDYEIRAVQSGNGATLKSKHGHPKKLIQKKAEDIEKLIAVSPKWAGGTTYRGMSLSKKELDNTLALLKQGKFHNFGTASWSTIKGKAIGFAESWLGKTSATFGDKKTQPVVLVLHKQKNATSIQHMSEYFGEYEVIASKDCRYKMVKTYKEGRYTIIEVEAI